MFLCVSFSHFVLVLLLMLCARFSLFSTKLADWLGTMSMKWPASILCPVRRKAVTQSFSQSINQLEAFQRWSAICSVWPWTLTYQKFLLCISSQGQDLYSHQKLNVHLLVLIWERLQTPTTMPDTTVQPLGRHFANQPQVLIVQLCDWHWCRWTYRLQSCGSLRSAAVTRSDWHHVILATLHAPRCMLCCTRVKQVRKLWFVFFERIQHRLSYLHVCYFGVA